MTKGRSSELRKFRVNTAGGIYHLRFSTYQRNRLFNFELGSKIAPLLYQVSAKYRVELLCWVIMPDHLHLLVRLPENTTLSCYVQKLKGDCTRRLRTCFDGFSTVWQDGYFDRAIRRDEDLKVIARYIISNPIRAGLVRSVREYALWNAAWL